ncbi:MAG TPA: S8 family serine peptidase, partial [Roseiflexaceae bacterium]|nr:S8 family serine peptidase [Roseiflexaceae bacterium]
MIRRSAPRIVVLLILTLLLPLSSQAQPSNSSHIPFTPRQPLSLPQPASEDQQPTRGIDDSLRNRPGKLGVVIELDGAPAAQAFAQVRSSGPAPQATRAAQAQLARIDQAQQRLLAPLASLGASVLYRTQRVYNGIAARIDAGKLSAIASLPGVRAIHPLVKYHLDLESSVPLIRAPQLWSGSNLTGLGVKIAIIDTGIDYVHTGFGGPGTQAAYDANNTTVLGDVPFPTAKVVAGYDFAGDDYDGNNTPQPDPDPMDCDGHGSHVAGIAAGNGVLASDAAFTGPYNDSNLYTNNNFEIGPGVAPQASLVALRVFGCEGGTELVSQALDWAVDPNGDGDFSDRVDVINMSLGSDFGYTNDPTSIAAENAVLAGTIVVSSAGNDGDSYFITGSPGTSPRVISVASSVDATDVLDGFRENTPTARTLPASFSLAFNWAESQPATANLVYP